MLMLIFADIFADAAFFRRHFPRFAADALKIFRLLPRLFRLMPFFFFQLRRRNADDTMPLRHMLAIFII